MKKLLLSNGFVAYVDDEDYERIRRFTWSALKNKNIWYAWNSKVGLLHRFILNVDDPQIVVDHKNSNGLNCQKSNLRICNGTLNNASQGKRVDGVTSKYKGVSKVGARFKAQITAYRQHHYLGTFDTQEEAALAYNEKAKELFGEFAFLNNVSDS